MRTAASGSASARCTPGSQRSASVAPAEAATFSARSRTSAESCDSSSGVMRCRLFIDSRRSMAYSTWRGSGCASSLTSISTEAGSTAFNAISAGCTSCRSMLRRKVIMYSLRALSATRIQTPMMARLT